MSLCNNLKQTKKVLQEWNKSTFGDIFQSIIAAEDEVLKLEANFEEDRTSEKRAVLEKAYSDLNYKQKIEEEFWKQKANVKWALEGESNTKYFHVVVKGKRKRGTIFSIKNSNGDLLTEAKDTE